MAAFSPRASREEKLRFLFTVHDIDGDGLLSSEDLQVMLRQLAGTSLRCNQSQRILLPISQCGVETHCVCAHNSEEEVKAVVMLALEEGCGEPSGGLDFHAFESALQHADLSNMQVEVALA